MRKGRSHWVAIGEEVGHEVELFIVMKHGTAGSQQVVRQV